MLVKDGRVVVDIVDANQHRALLYWPDITNTTLRLSSIFSSEKLESTHCYLISGGDPEFNVNSHLLKIFIEKGCQQASSGKHAMKGVLHCAGSSNFRLTCMELLCGKLERRVLGL